MERYLNFILPQRTEKCFVREIYDGNTVQTFFCFKDVTVNFAKRAGTTTNVTDLYALELLKKGLITKEQLDRYYGLICREYHFKDCHMDQSQTEIYDFILGCRHSVFGYDALAAGRQMRRENAPIFDPAKGIGQRAKKAQLLEKSSCAIFLLTAPELFFEMQADICCAQKQGKAVYVCASADGSGDLPDKKQLSGWLGNTRVNWLETTREGVAFNSNLQTAIDRGAACLLYYGEDGLLHCRDLALDAIVTARPLGYHAQALCAQSGDPRDNCIYIPAGRDITPYVPVIAQTRLTYYHLAKLWKACGDGIYDLRVLELYKNYPEIFVNIYDTRENAPIPIAASGDDFAAFDRSKDASVYNYVNRLSNVSYTAAYFDENLRRQPICYEEGCQQPGILVHSIRVKKAKGAKVIQCPRGVTPRKLLESKDFSSTALVSNFLFFMTPKLDILYNHLRQDRPLEQTDASAGHLDYMLCWENGVRKETFPLFKKCCVAMTDDGQFRFFNYRLGGGNVRIGSTDIRWESADVDPENAADVCVYTPFSTAELSREDRETYTKPVGVGRVNIVILQDRIVAIRKGDVLLPGAGVVISLAEPAADGLLSGLKSLKDGYYDVSGLVLQVHLDGPEEVEKEVWDRVQWAWGGGLSMILDGVAMGDKNDMPQWFSREGWMSPLSRQTQESVYHKSVKHPRTAIGMAENGDLLLLVMSGRSWRSTGANYEEIIGITRALYPDVKTLMNMDGGGSAVLGLTAKGSFLELSCPATSTGSTVGMVRPINTMLYIPAEMPTRYRRRKLNAILPELTRKRSGIWIMKKPWKRGWSGNFSPSTVT